MTDHESRNGYPPPIRRVMAEVFGLEPPYDLGPISLEMVHAQARAIVEGRDRPVYLGDGYLGFVDADDRRSDRKIRRAWRRTGDVGTER